MRDVKNQQKNEQIVFMRNERRFHHRVIVKFHHISKELQNQQFHSYIIHENVLPQGLIKMCAVPMHVHDKKIECTIQKYLG